ncbi:MAG: ribbon-helix-helix domain-containing protein [Clostridia bacterium]
MATTLKNVTFSLPVELIEKFKEFAKNNYIPSLNAGVKEALEDYSKMIEKEMLKKKMTEAANDSLFMEDLNDSMLAFELSDKEISSRTTKW